MKPTVVYPYKKTWTRELDYSIKSLKNVPHNGVYIIGDKPDYDVPATVITPKPHTLPRTAYNDVINKIRTACLEIDSDDLLLMNDDIFLLEPYDLTVYDRGDLLDHIQERIRTDLYKKLLQSTHDWLIRNGYTTVNYETHTPLLFNMKKMLKLINTIKPELGRGAVLGIRSLYGNMYSVPSETIKDVKNPKNYKGLPIISTNEHTFIGEIGQYIRGVL